MAEQFQIVIDPTLDRRVEGAVAFGDFEGDAVYDGLPAFFEDLIRGRPFPTNLVARELTPSIMVAVTVFLHRNLALHPGMLPLVASCGLVDRFGMAGMAHIDRDLAKFFKLLVAYMPAEMGRTERQTKLETVVGWVQEYVERGRFPALPPEPKLPRILDTGTGGFVLAEGLHLEDGWLELFRQGFIWGVMLTPAQDDRRRVLAARKSAFAPMDTRKGAAAFNDAERAMGEHPGWQADELWLWGPPKGTLLLPTHIVDVLIRI